jgi:hypothetical protein
MEYLGPIILINATKKGEKIGIMKKTEVFKKTHRIFFEFINKHTTAIIPEGSQQRCVCFNGMPPELAMKK